MNQRPKPDLAALVRAAQAELKNAGEEGRACKALQDRVWLQTTQSTNKWNRHAFTKPEDVAKDVIADSATEFWSYFRDPTKSIRPEEVGGLIKKIVLCKLYFYANNEKKVQKAIVEQETVRRLNQRLLEGSETNFVHLERARELLAQAKELRSHLGALLKCWKGDKSSSPVAPGYRWIINEIPLQRGDQTQLAVKTEKTTDQVKYASDKVLQALVEKVDESKRSERRMEAFAQSLFEVAGISRKVKGTRVPRKPIDLVNYLLLIDKGDLDND